MDVAYTGLTSCRRITIATTLARDTARLTPITVTIEGLWLYGERVMKTWSILRLTMAVLILAAMTAEFRGAMSTTPAEGSSMATVVVNYFSYFTIESNLLAAVALIAAGVWALTRNTLEPTWLAVLMAAATTFMAITGLVYNLLLRGLVPAAFPWANEILHLIGPLFLVVDLFVAPPRRRLLWRAVGMIIAFPVVWAVYTLIRGDLVVSPLTGDPWWYPYPFLNHHLQGGYAVVIAYVIGIAAAFTLVAWGVVAVGRRRSPETASADEEDGAGLRPV